MKIASRATPEGLAGHGLSTIGLILTQIIDFTGTSKPETRINFQWCAEVWWCPGRLLDCMHPNKFYSIEQWRMVVIVAGYTLFVTSNMTSYSRLQTNVRYGEVCWHNMHITLHALSLLVVVQCLCNEHKLSALQVRRPGQKNRTQR